MFNKIKYFDSKEKCMKGDKSIPTLLDWNDFEDEYQLLIPMDEKRNKTSGFKAPVIYYNIDTDKSIIEKVWDAISGNDFGKVKFMND